jgi:hypothetical protein
LKRKIDLTIFHFSLETNSRNIDSCLNLTLRLIRKSDQYHAKKKKIYLSLRDMKCTHSQQIWFLLKSSDEIYYGREISFISWELHVLFRSLVIYLTQAWSFSFHHKNDDFFFIEDFFSFDWILYFLQFSNTFSLKKYE